MEQIKVNRIRWNTIIRAENRDFAPKRHCSLLRVFASATLTNRMTECKRQFISHYIRISYRCINFSTEYSIFISFYCSIRKHNAKFSMLVKSKLTHVGFVEFLSSHFFFFAFFLLLSMLRLLALFTNHLCAEEKKKIKLSIAQWCAQFKKRPHLRYTHTHRKLFHCFIIERKLRSKCKINEAQTTNFLTFFRFFAERKRERVIGSESRGESTFMRFQLVSIDASENSAISIPLFLSLSLNLVVIFPFTCHHQQLDSFSKAYEFLYSNRNGKNQVAVDHFCR